MTDVTTLLLETHDCTVSLTVEGFNCPYSSWTSDPLFEILTYLSCVGLVPTPSLLLVLDSLISSRVSVLVDQAKVRYLFLYPLLLRKSEPTTAVVTIDSISDKLGVTSTFRSRHLLFLPLILNLLNPSEVFCT